MNEETYVEFTDDLLAGGAIDAAITYLYFAAFSVTFVKEDPITTATLVAQTTQKL